MVKQDDATIFFFRLEGKISRNENPAFFFLGGGSRKTKKHQETLETKIVSCTWQEFWLG